MSSSSGCLTHRSLTQLLRTPILWAADLTGLSEGRGTPTSHLRRHKQRSHFTRRLNWPRLGVSTTRLPMRTASRILAAIFTICARTRSLLTAWPRILRKIPGARSRFIGGRFPWRRLSERPARGRNMRCVFQAGGGLERPFWAQLPLRLVRKINPNYNQGEPMTDRHRLKDS